MNNFKKAIKWPQGSNISSLSGIYIIYYRKTTGTDKSDASANSAEYQKRHRFRKKFVIFVLSLRTEKNLLCYLKDWLIILQRQQLENYKIVGHIEITETTKEGYTYPTLSTLQKFMGFIVGNDIYNWGIIDCCCWSHCLYVSTRFSGKWNVPYVYTCETNVPLEIYQIFLTGSIQAVFLAGLVVSNGYYVKSSTDHDNFCHGGHGILSQLQRFMGDRDQLLNTWFSKLTGGMIVLDQITSTECKNLLRNLWQLHFLASLC
ncbi:hypothetical protein BDA99DRAFT_531740 [Phascolomyces articulosus]|uniref:Uncharacterized protein n=1 Tax=Phascolomyces articulosus TaxID=60185 RepID=A0AAD5KSV8_9FUNG|nr:hypothetical protein BDA99DRAFT_531740 [Phascolomyces articulosus]